MNLTTRRYPQASVDIAAHSVRICLMPNHSNVDINLLPKTAHQRASLGQQLFRLIIGSGKTIIVITEAIVLLVFLSRFKLDRQITDLNEKIENKQAIITSAQTLEKEHNRIKTKLTKIANILESQINWPQRISNFDQKMPEGLTLEEISYDHQSITVLARVKTAQEFGVFIQTLTNDENLSSITLESSSYNKGSNEYKFGLNIVLSENET